MGGDDRGRERGSGAGSTFRFTIRPPRPPAPLRAAVTSAGRPRCAAARAGRGRQRHQPAHPRRRSSTPGACRSRASESRGSRPCRGCARPASRLRPRHPRLADAGDGRLALARRIRADARLGAARLLILLHLARRGEARAERARGLSPRYLDKPVKQSQLFDAPGRGRWRPPATSALRARPGTSSPGCARRRGVRASWWPRTT